MTDKRSTDTANPAGQSELFGSSIGSLAAQLGNSVSAGRVHRLADRRPPQDPEEVKRNKQQDLQAEILSINEISPWKSSPGVGYVPRVLVQATLPYREPKGDAYQYSWSRKSGELILSIQPGLEENVIESRRLGRPVMQPRGYPYGTIPRLFLIWVMTYVKEYQTRTLHLGESARDFMNAMGIEAKGGHDYRRVRDQLTRLLTARISVTYANKDKRTGLENEGFDHISIADKGDLWWRPIGSDGQDSTDQTFVFRSVLTLSERFYSEVLASPVPIDMRRLRLFKASPMAIDLYCWLTYRNYALCEKKQPQVFVPWSALQQSFGGGSEHGPKFAQSFKQAYERVCEMGYAPRVEFDKRGVMLYQSAPDVPSKSQRLLEGNVNVLEG